MTLLAKQRQAAILNEVRRRGGVRVSELIDMLGVSDMTIRRDLVTLAHDGLLEKVHGGAAVLPEHSTTEPGFRAKSLREHAEKEAIAASAAEFVTPGAAIAMTAGTTTHALARRLVDVPRLTVVTNSLPLAEVLYEANGPDQTVVLTGGVRTPSDALAGAIAVEAIRSLHVDILFMGIHGMDEHAGFTAPNLLEAEVDRALVEAARQLVIVADHTKFGVVGLSTITSLDEADVLVTDDGLAPAQRELLAERVGRLIVVPVSDRGAQSSG